MGQSIGLLDLLYSGLGNLAAYLAAHVLLCLLPAFFIAGAMTALIPKESITRFLGRNRPKYISYPAAAASGSLLAVCSCTIVPLFAGIYKKGAGIGPAITFLFFAPSANILALIYTGGLIGTDLAFARFFLSLVFGIGIGMIMALIFSKEDTAHDAAADAMFAGNQEMKRSAFALITLLVVLLLSGTLKIGLLTNTYATLTLPVASMDTLQETLLRLVPFDPSKGEEGVSAQGAILIVLLVLIGGTAWKGLENVFDGLNQWSLISLTLVAISFLSAAVGMTPHAGGLDILINGKFIGVALSIAAIYGLLVTKFTEEETCSFLWESWKFVKQIFPLLIVGVFAVGVIRQIIRPEWIEAIAGENTVIGNLTGVLFGIFMYFPTLVEVPIAKMFLDLGMHRGPLLAYLMADPELSLQSMLITATIIGRVKTVAYVVCVAIFSVLSGLLYGMWIDGASIPRILLYLTAFLAVLFIGLWRESKRNVA
jgi:uncharacterized membrane protein YraQ (UPF0718 family)